MTLFATDDYHSLCLSFYPSIFDMMFENPGGNLLVRFPADFYVTLSTLFFTKLLVAGRLIGDVKV